MRLALAAIALAAVTLPATAEEIDCTDPQTQTDMTLCAQADLDTADERLNALYATMRERLKGDDAKLTLLRDAQRAWVAYRDAECAFQSSAVEGGSAQPMVEAQCATEKTTRRNADFEATLACEEGDVACPLPAR
ncbi:lysozyme inhibitor LprI family protein [Aureimonas sp. SK2]|uniref:lysozyme inhibitor LprI family protein n=1 Tax=Aureimonas sp. SK2 TaxID=3015992 RepID=UPI002443F9E4|nr:lysozyme inhibitor LprI family protein [Aureimonas sp. SK2]